MEARVRRLKKLPFDLFVDIDEDHGSTDKDGEPMVKCKVGRAD
jgi:hypothetical protein